MLYQSKTQTKPLEELVMQQAPYGTWQSTISAAQLAASSVTLYDTVGDKEFIYNVEMRPNESARYVIVRYNPDGTKIDVLPAPFSARTKVHEYGGRAFTVHDDTIYFVNFKDDNFYKFKVGAEPKLLASGVRFAEPTMTSHGIIAVGERHTVGTEAENFVALIDPETGSVTDLIKGYDFYAFPTVNKDGNRIAWICWNHPNMPWDDTQLWAADLVEGRIENSHRIFSQQPQSFYQPQWTDENHLVFHSDRTNWWNPYIWHARSDTAYPIYSLDAEFAKPMWNLGVLTWGFFNDCYLFSFSKDGATKIAIVDPKNKNDRTILDLPYTFIDRLCIHNGNAYFIGSSATTAPELVRYSAAGELTVLSEKPKFILPPNAVSSPKHIKYPTKSRQGAAYAYYYPPTNPEYNAPDGTKPPLMIVIHGGPTSAAIGAFSLAKQYWTSRGFAVADVNYGGSTGYGREYRKALQRDDEHSAGYWGDVDIKDCVACVKYLVDQGWVDPAKVVIRGGSAGGYTTMAALAFTDVFAAGTSYYGVSDILALAKETHKFESRYMDQLVGELPKFLEVYKQRSPIENLDKFKAPILVLQGDEDKIVLPNQAEMLVEALKARGVYVEFKMYNGEQHGFRKAETIIDSLERELQFYLKVFENKLDLSVNNSEETKPNLLAT